MSEKKLFRIYEGPYTKDLVHSWGVYGIKYNCYFNELTVAGSTQVGWHMFSRRIPMVFTLFKKNGSDGDWNFKDLYIQIADDLVACAEQVQDALRWAEGTKEWAANAYCKEHGYIVVGEKDDPNYPGEFHILTYIDPDTGKQLNRPHTSK